MQGTFSSTEVDSNLGPRGTPGLVQRARFRVISPAGPGNPGVYAPMALSLVEGSWWGGELGFERTSVHRAFGCPGFGTCLWWCCPGRGWRSGAGFPTTVAVLPLLSSKANGVSPRKREGTHSWR